jgi:nitronate monooxygenase
MSAFTRLYTPACDLLKVRYPIMLAAMDLVADATLTQAVTEAGGFGCLGGGYGDRVWLENELAKLHEWRSGRVSGAKPSSFGVGFITWSLAKQPDLLDIALEFKPDALWLSFGDPAPFAEKARAKNVPVVCQVQTVAMAIDAVAKGANLVIAQGGEAGGHGASRGTFALVPAVVDAVGHQVPVFAAGGIADGRGLAAALMLGAQGVVMGTRFYASQEAAGHAEAKRRIVQAQGDETLRSLIFDVSRNNVWPSPFNGRCLLNEHAKRWQGKEMELMRRLSSEGPLYLEARAKGDFDVAAVIAGEGVDMIHEVQSVATIVSATLKQARSLLGEVL